MSREDYLRRTYGQSPGATTSSAANAPNYPGNQTYTSTGTPNFGSNVGTSGVGTNVSGITGLITDPKADEDAGVYESDKSLFDKVRENFTSPQDTYASDLDFINIDAKTVQDLGLTEKFANNEFTISDEVLNFFGVDPNNPQSIPKELYQMIAEGSIVTPMEAMNPGQVIIGYDKKTGDPIVGNEPGVGTYSDLEAGDHPLLGSLNKYYSIMSGSAFPGAVTGGSGKGRINAGGGGDYAAGIAAGLGRRPKQLGDEEGIPKGLRLLQYMINLHKENPYTKMAIRKKNGGIVSLVGG